MPEGWVWTSIDDIAFVTKLAGFEYTEYIANNLTGHDGVPLFKGKNVQDGKIIYHFESFIPKEISDELPRSQVRRKCLLTPYVGTIGNIGIHDKEGFYHLGSNVGKIEILNGNQTDIYEEYVKLFLQSTSGYKELTKQKKATAQDSISIEAIREVLIPIPPRGEQQRILQEISHWLSFVESIEQAETSINDTICAAKARILELAIHGKLVPQDPSDKPAIELLKRINPAFKPSDNLHYGENLPTGWICATYEMLNQHKNRSINPMDSPKEQFELYSVPIYETGCPEYLSGKEIGSTKQAVEKGDVLLCKINPHLNRAWAVEHHNPKLKCIASSEWLIFQSDALCPDYARMFFMSPSFRTLMLSNVSGVGGSLMRARASAVDGYPILVPPINEQKRMVKVVKAYHKILDEIVAGLS